jgi:adenosylcobinamide-GDP ribazoletransferase
MPRGDAVDELAPEARPSLTGALAAAIVFLTRVPMRAALSRADQRAAASFFPVVGTLVGAASAFIFVIVHRAGSLVSAACAVGASMMITGALHEDGLADTADALGGASDRAKLFAILKDSRIGAFGAAALSITIVLRVALLARLDLVAPIALVAVHASARTAPTWLMAALPYVTSDSSSKSGEVRRAGAIHAAIATVLAIAIVGALVATHRLMLVDAAVLACASIVVSLLCAWRFRVRAGGVTGDFLGATEQLVECASLLALALVRGGA